MRNIKRIYPFLTTIKESWQTYPDLRFGQLIYNFTKWLKEEKQQDLFYIEDDKFIEFFKEYMKE